jgi:hypothetical protein
LGFSILDIEIYLGFGAWKLVLVGMEIRVGETLC